jgi:hypothetical protein
MATVYEQELELLILDKLLPGYLSWQKVRGIINPYQGINENLLKQIRLKKRLPALLRPKEI